MEVLRVRMVAVVWIASTSTAANARLVTLAQSARQVGQYNNDKLLLFYTSICWSSLYKTASTDLAQLNYP